MNKAAGVTAKILFGWAVYAVLPMAGWGLKDASGFVSNRVRLAYIVFTVMAMIAAVTFDPSVGRQGGRFKSEVARQRISVLLLQILSLAAVLASPWDDRRAFLALPVADAVRWTGLFLFLAGFAVMNWAETTLGGLFSVQVGVREGHRLVTTGPYAAVRHPRYAGILVNTAGLSLVFRSGLGLLLTAALAAVLLWRIRDEEAMMAAEFGGAWEAYRRTTKKLAPFLY
jgi:protein-S-isoprenylcysteine O-methyltransferase Ste14